MLQQRYRKDYSGEYVILSTLFRDGRKMQQREWVPNRIINQHVSGRAVVLCGSQPLGTYEVSRLAKHKGGLLASKKLQIYGINSVWKTVACEFLVCHDQDEIEKIVESGYSDRCVIYTNPPNLMKYPDNFYLVPYSPAGLSTPATAMYLAAFDGHKEVFVLNFNDATDKEARQAITVVQAYQSTQFIFVSEHSDPRPSAMKDLSNCQFMNLRQWVTHCDV